MKSFILVSPIEIHIKVFDSPSRGLTAKELFNYVAPSIFIGLVGKRVVNIKTWPLIPKRVFR